MAALALPMLIVVGVLFGIITELAFGYFSVGFVSVFLVAIFFAVKSFIDMVEVECPKCKRETMIKGAAGNCRHCHTKIIVTHDGEVIEG